MKTYGQPLLYAIASIAGLVLALLSEGGVGDALGLVLIASPLWPLVRGAIAFRRTP